MKKFTLESNILVKFKIEGIKAEDKEKAIRKAFEIINTEIKANSSFGGLGFDYAEMEGVKNGPTFKIKRLKNTKQKGEINE